MKECFFYPHRYKRQRFIEAQAICFKVPVKIQFNYYYYYYFPSLALERKKMCQSVVRHDKNTR